MYMGYGTGSKYVWYSRATNTEYGNGN